MAENAWNRWKMTTIGIGLAIGAAILMIFEVALSGAADQMFGK